MRVMRGSSFQPFTLVHMRAHKHRPSLYSHSYTCHSDSALPSFTCGALWLPLVYFWNSTFSPLAGWFEAPCCQPFCPGTTEGPSHATAVETTGTSAMQLLACKEDFYNGIIVTPESLPKDVETFTQQMIQSLAVSHQLSGATY